MMLYLQLFISFFKIGLFGFGGGYAILSLIQHEVLGYGWLSQSELTDIVAISQVTPGPIGINCATYVGYTATGSILGAAIATFALILPSVIIMFLLFRFVLALQGSRYLEYAFMGLRPVVIGLIAAAALVLVNAENFIDYKSYLLFVVAFVLSFKFKMHPILLVVLAGLAGLVLY